MEPDEYDYYRDGDSESFKRWQRQLEEDAKRPGKTYLPKTFTKVGIAVNFHDAFKRFDDDKCDQVEMHFNGERRTFYDRNTLSYTLMKMTDAFKWSHPIQDNKTKQ